MNASVHHAQLLEVYVWIKTHALTRSEKGLRTVKNIKITVISFTGVCLLALLAQVASVNAQPKGKIKADNKAKPPPTVKALFVPDLRLRGSESVEVNAVVPKSYHKVTFSFQNWDRFPVEMLQPTAKPPSLPPNPCKQVQRSELLFAVLHSEVGKILGCTALKPNEDFYFLLEKEKPIPEFVYVSVVDRQTRKTYKSSLVSPSSGATK